MTHWRLPRTSITLERIEEGPRQGDYVFSAATVARAVEFYEAVEHLPYRDSGPLVDGAGVGGLALALAAQDTLKGISGSLTIILDRTYRVGDRIVARGYDGVVESIGLRSTRIRLLNGRAEERPERARGGDGPL